MTPATHLALRDNCAQNGGMVGGDDRTLPCAITKRDPRTAADYASAAPATRPSSPPTSSRCRKWMAPTRPSWCSRATTTVSARAPTRRRMASRSGAACRIAASPSTSRCRSDNAVRRGVVVTFFPGTANEFRLMSVHLKSGCPAGPLTAEGRNCELLSRQVAPLEAWIEEQAQRRPPLRRARRFQPPLHASRRARARSAGPTAERLRRDRRSASPRPRNSPTSPAREKFMPVHHGQRVPRIHRQHPAGPRSREERC